MNDKINEQSSIAEVKIKGLGSVFIIRTSEGIEVEVKNGPEKITSVKVDNSAFEDPYDVKVIKGIQRVVPDADVSEEFINEAFKQKMSPMEASEEWFSLNQFDISELTPLEGKASGFYQEVQKFGHPYIKISETDYNKLMRKDFDYYKTIAGRVVAYGTTETGFALMPLRKKYAARILKQNI